MDICIICKGENPITEQNPLTDEHIVPEFIGGVLKVKNVCKICNSVMGGGFEGNLANSLFYKLIRFIHNIEAKQKALNFPFTGTYEDDEIGKFKVLPNGDLYLIPDVQLSATENGVEISMSIDRSDINKAETYLIRKLSRRFKSVNQDKISKSVTEFIKNADKELKSIQSPKVTKEIVPDFNSQIMLYTKIAYELAIYHFGGEYINDPIAIKLRLALKNQTPDKTVHGLFPADKQSYGAYFDDDHHWVMFLNNACFIKLFGFPAVIEFSDKESDFVDSEGVVYKFCYKSLSFTKLTLLEQINETNQNEELSGSKQN